MNKRSRFTNPDDGVTRREAIKAAAAGLGALALDPTLFAAVPEPDQPFGAEFPNLDSLAVGEWWAKPAPTSAVPCALNAGVTRNGQIAKTEPRCCLIVRKILAN